MCGIIGYIGENAVSVALDKLKLLEYRGYDSAGVAYINDGQICTRKAVGRISNLEKKIDEESTVAIAHTRWATHGKVNETNAHPHAYSHSWSIVHNGIIENYKELSCGAQLKTQTDSEVIAYLLSKNGSGLSSILNSARELQGSFAVVALDENGKLFAIKNKSPLYLAKGENGILLASDPSCFCAFATHYYEFEDGECAEISPTLVSFYDFDGNEKTKSEKSLVIQSTLLSKGDWAYYMQKEIYDTPLILDRINKAYSIEYLQEFAKAFEKYEKIYFIGCGTAYHASLYGAYLFNENTSKDCRAFMAGEYRYCKDKTDEKTACVFVSQSGETADTLGAMEKAKNCGAYTVALTNVGYSTLASKCDFVLPVLAGVERAVASTKAYSAQINVLRLIAYYLQYRKRVEIPVLTTSAIDDLAKKAEKLATKLLEKSDAFLIGRKADYVSALECSLKIKEVGYLNANAYPASELKHGFIALIDNDTPVITFITDQTIASKTISGAMEAKSRGAYSVLITCLENQDESEFDVVIKTKNENELTIFFQLLAYYIAILQGNDPDMPKNLAKSVTVE